MRSTINTGPNAHDHLFATQLRQNTKVVEDFYTNWDKPLLTAFGSDDPLMAGVTSNGKGPFQGRKDKHAL